MSFLIDGFSAHELALTIERAGVGLFFALSGYHKLFFAQRHADLVQTLKANRIPCIRFMEWWVPGWELIAGTFLAFGLFSVASAAVLAFICLVATCTDGLARIQAYQPLDKADWLDDLLYLPEVLYGIMLLTVVLAGPTAYSLDTLLWGNK